MRKSNDLLVQNLETSLLKRGWRVPQLADATGLSLGGLYGIVKGLRWPSPDNLDRIAKALDTTPDRLIADPRAARTPTIEEAMRVLEKALDALPKSPVRRRVLERLSALDDGQVEELLAVIEADAAAAEEELEPSEVPQKPRKKHKKPR